MKLQTLFSRLEKSAAWKEAKKENPEIFFCAGFFIMNFKQKIFEYSLDFRDEKNLFGFKLPVEEKGENSEIIFTKDELLESPKPLPEIKNSQVFEIKKDIEELKEIIEKALLENNIKNTLDEVVAVLQLSDGKLIWHLTCICSSFVIVNIQIDPLNNKILKFEKKNLMDFASVRKPEKK